MKGFFARRWLKWSLAVIAGIAGLLLAALAVVYILGERLLSRETPLPAVTAAVSSDPAVLAEGERLARITGCTGCHRSDLGGGVLFDGGLVFARLVASNLTQAATRYSDAELDRAVRYGVSRNGRALVGMPSAMFHHLSDEDYGAIVAYLRSMPPIDRTLPRTRVGPLARWFLLTGKFELDADVVEKQGAVKSPPNASGDLARGKYLAHIACIECHGQDLGGNSGIGGGTPHLAIARGYTADQFAHFMRTGEALGGRELRLMSNVARGRFSHFSDDEITALHRYLSQIGTADGTD